MDDSCVNDWWLHHKRDISYCFSECGRWCSVSWWLLRWSIWTDIFKCRVFYPYAPSSHTSLPPSCYRRHESNGNIKNNTRIWALYLWGWAPLIVDSSRAWWTRQHCYKRLALLYWQSLSDSSAKQPPQKPSADWTLSSVFAEAVGNVSLL